MKCMPVRQHIAKCTTVLTQSEFAEFRKLPKFGVVKSGFPETFTEAISLRQGQ